MLTLDVSLELLPAKFRKESYQGTNKDQVFVLGFILLTVRMFQGLCILFPLPACLSQQSYSLLSAFHLLSAAASCISDLVHSGQWIIYKHSYFSTSNFSSKMFLTNVCQGYNPVHRFSEIRNTTEYYSGVFNSKCSVVFFNNPICPNNSVSFSGKAPPAAVVLLTILVCGWLEVF